MRIEILEGNDLFFQNADVVWATADENSINGMGVRIIFMGLCNGQFLLIERVFFDGCILYTVLCKTPGQNTCSPHVGRVIAQYSGTRVAIEVVIGGYLGGSVR
jgi:hypothetical protein